MPSFSQRQGYAHPKDIEFREDLPEHLRIPLYRMLIEVLNGSFLLERAKKLLNPYGLDALPRYAGSFDITKEEDDPATIEFKRIFLGCEWFEIYDIVEDVLTALRFHEEELAQPDETPRAFPLQQGINDYFLHAAIGWQIIDGKVITRGDDAFEQSVKIAETDLNLGGRSTAAERIGRAIRNLSVRPNPDFSGAISHATSAIECVLGDVTGENMTLGEYLKRFDLIPGSMKKALEGIWGYASSEGARHGKEGAEPPREEAEFIVAVAAAVTTYLNRKHPRK
jgi:hypothetical protein